MGRLVEAETTPVVHWGQALVGVLREVDAVIASPARHQWGDHYLGSHVEGLAHEVLGQILSLLDNDAAEFVSQRERPRQGFGQCPLRMC
jgi:hypothetical protein